MPRPRIIEPLSCSASSRGRTAAPGSRRGCRAPRGSWISGRAPPRCSPAPTGSSPTTSRDTAACPNARSRATASRPLPCPGLYRAARPACAPEPAGPPPAHGVRRSGRAADPPPRRRRRCARRGRHRPGAGRAGRGRGQRGGRGQEPAAGGDLAPARTGGQARSRRGEIQDLGITLRAGEARVLRRARRLRITQVGVFAARAVVNRHAETLCGRRQLFLLDQTVSREVGQQHTVVTVGAEAALQAQARERRPDDLGVRRGDVEPQRHTCRRRERCGVRPRRRPAARTRGSCSRRPARSRRRPRPA